MNRRINITEALRGILFRNWKNKGVALFLTLVVWAYAFGATQEEQPFSIEVDLRVHDSQRNEFAVKEVRSLRGAPLLSLESPDVDVARFGVNVKLKGPRKLLRNFSEALLHGFVEVRPESQEYDLLRDLSIVDLPQGVSIESVDPATLRVRLEPIRVESKEIQSQSRGTPDPSFQAKPRFDFTPPRLELIGPESALAEARILSETIDVSDLNELVTKRAVKVFVSGSNRVRIKGDPPQVGVSITLEDATELRDIRVPVQFGVPPLDRQIGIEAAPEVVIRFQGTKVALDQLETHAADKDSPFYLLYVLERDQVSDDRIFSVLHDEFRWLHGQAPSGIRIVGFADESPSYTVSLSVKGQPTGN